MPAFVQFIPVDKVVDTALRPAPRGPIDFLRVDAATGGYIELGRCEYPLEAFPIDACGGRAGIGQPIEHDIVDDFII